MLTAILFQHKPKTRSVQFDIYPCHSIRQLFQTLLPTLDIISLGRGEDIYESVMVSHYRYRRLLSCG